MMDFQKRLRQCLQGLEPYDPAFTPCEVNLSANENTHGMPDQLRELVNASLAATPLNRYPDPMSNDVRDALAQWHGLSRGNVMVSNGGDELLFNLLYTFGGPEHTLINCTPSFSVYDLYARMTETPVVNIPRRSDFTVDEEAVLAAAPQAGLIFITNPNNPTGDVVSAGFVERLLAATDALVLMDEAYVEFSAPGTSAVPLIPSSPNLIVLRTLSKAFACAGVRCGYLLADPQVITALTIMRQPYSVDVMAQAVAQVAIANRAMSQPVIDDIITQRQVLSEGLAALAPKGLESWPSQSNFILVRMPHAHEVRVALRDEYSILVRDFSSAPGLTDCLRITVGTQEENERLLAALGQLLS